MNLYTRTQWIHSVCVCCEATAECLMWMLNCLASLLHGCRQILHRHFYKNGDGQIKCIYLYIMKEFPLPGAKCRIPIACWTKKYENFSFMSHVLLEWLHTFENGAPSILLLATAFGNCLVGKVVLTNWKNESSEFTEDAKQQRGCLSFFFYRIFVSWWTFIASISSYYFPTFTNSLC